MPTRTANVTRIPVPVKTKDKTSKPKVQPKIAVASPVMWAIGVLTVMNAILEAKGDKRRVPISVTNVNTLLRPITGEGSMAQQGGFLRDNNPWNIGTGCSPTGAYGGTPKAPYGADSRCGGGPVYLNTFATPLAGMRATAQYLLDTKALIPLIHSAPSSMTLAGTWYRSDAKAQPAGGGATQHDIDTVLNHIASGGTLGLGGLPISVGTAYTGTTKGGTLNVKPPPGVNVGVANAWLAYLSQPGHNAKTKLPEALQDRILALSPAARAATEQYVLAIVASERNLSLVQQLEAAGSGIASGVTGAVSSVASDFIGLAKLLANLGDPTFWKRIGIGAAGIALIVGGVILFVATTGPAKSLEAKVV